jgi:hypothetical protein
VKFWEGIFLATKKTSTATKKTATTAAKKATKTVAAKTTKAAAATKKAAVSKKYAYIFFNCDEAKSQSSMNIFYNDVIFSDTKAGRKALLSKVEEEVAAGRVNVADMEAVKSAILDGEPTDAAGKMQYGDIERIVAAA